MLITHDHSDHISQLRTFRELPIYSPVELPDVDTFRVRPLQEFFIEKIKVTPLALSHDALNTTGYILDDGSEKLTYITDTGYVNERYFDLIRGSDYIVLECNHDPDTLMQTGRPYYVKQRIIGEEGHLCNEDCAEVLDQVITPNTKMVILAHISQEGNTRQLALKTVCTRLKDNPNVSDLVVAAAGQYEIAGKGESDEEIICGSVSYHFDLEHLAQRSSS